MLPLARTLRIALVGALALVMLVALAPAADACSAAKRASARKTPSTAGRAPLLIGDSTSILAVPRLAALGIAADAHGCRQFAEGVRMLAARRRAHQLPHVVIVALGSNGPIAGAQISRALRIIGRDRVLALVTPPRSGVSAGAMRSAARRNSNRVLLIDWAKISSRHGGWFAGDGLHPGYNGAAAFARIIKRAVTPFAFPQLRRLRLPKDSAKSRFCGVLHRGGERLRVFLVREDDRSTCAGARSVVRSSPLRDRAGWSIYDLRAVRQTPWRWAYRSNQRRVLIATKR